MGSEFWVTTNSGGSTSVSTGLMHEVWIAEQPNSMV